MKITINNIVGHLKTIIVHKFWVFYYSCKLGIPVQGFLHDLSKFSPIEFWESVKYYQEGKRSPINACKEDKGYSLAWQHHKGRNKHHYEYWTDNYDIGTTCIKIPYKYVLELVCDYLAAGRTYKGKYFTFLDEYNWWLTHKDIKKIHAESKNLITNILYELAFSPDKNKTFYMYRRTNKENTLIYNNL